MSRISLRGIDPTGASDGDGPVYDAATDQLVYKPSGGIQSIVAGAGISVDTTDPKNPVVSATGGGGGGGTGERVDNPSDPLWAGSLGYDQEFDTDDTSGALPAGWSWFNQGPATYTQQFGAGVLNTPGQAGDSVRGIVRPIPSEGSWTATAKVSLSAADVMNVSSGLLLRDSVSGKIQTLEILRYSRQSYVNNWSSATAFSSTAAGSVTPLVPPKYARFHKNSATSWDAYWSADGIAWFKLMSAYDTSTFITPDQIGFFLYKSGAVQTAASCHWFRVR